MVFTIEMPNGMKVHCNNEEEVVRILKATQGRPAGRPKKARVFDPRTDSVQESWDKAAKFAAKHGIPKNVARSLISEAKKRGIKPEDLLGEYK